jgi:hypothetical protein
VYFNIFFFMIHTPEHGHDFTVKNLNRCHDAFFFSHTLDPYEIDLFAPTFATENSYQAFGSVMEVKILRSLALPYFLGKRPKLCLSFAMTLDNKVGPI